MRRRDLLQWGFPLAAIFVALLTVSCAKRADPAPKPQPPPLFEFLNAWGDKGEGPGKFNQPVAFAADVLGNIFFADPGAGFVHKFESKGTPLLSFEDPRLHHASGITVDSGGAIYVSDAERGTILIFFPDGTFYRSRQAAPQPHFSGPLGISVDITGHLYVPDPAHSRVAKFDAQGRLVKSWPVPKVAAADERPSAIATVKDDSVFVAFGQTGRVEKYSSDGALITSWIATDGLGARSHSITGFAVTDDFVFTLVVPGVTPGSGPEIRVWTLGGQSKLDADLGEHLGTMTAPQIAVTPHDELLVFDPSAPRVFRFRIHLKTGNVNDVADHRI